jgi:hypothetical protein
MGQSVIKPAYPPVEVVCEQCGKRQWNMEECGPVPEKMTKKWKGYSPCIYCGHAYARISKS